MLGTGPPLMMLVGKSAPFAMLELLAVEQAAALRSRYEGGATNDQHRVSRAIICSAHDAGCWIACDCNDARAVMAPALRGATYYLRRLPQYGEHAVSCVFRFDEADYQDAAATALDGRRQRTAAEFVRILGKPALRPESPALRDRAQSSQLGASSSALASLLWELIERAGVNRVGPVPAASPASTLSSELARLRNAAQGIRISPDISLLDVLTTYGNDYFGSSRWHVRFREAVPKFLSAGLQPQAFLMAYSRAINTKEIVLSEGTITCQGRVTMPRQGDPAMRGPYLALVVATDLKDGAGLQAIRAYAQPVQSARHLMPVESGWERDALEMLFAFREMAVARFASLKITITKPVFEIVTEIGPVCPAFVLNIASPRQPKGISICIDLTDEDETGTTSAWTGRQKRLSLLGPILQIPRTSLKLPRHGQVSWLLDALYGPRGVLNNNRTVAP